MPAAATRVKKMSAAQQRPDCFSFLAGAGAAGATCWARLSYSGEWWPGQLTGLHWWVLPGPVLLTALKLEVLPGAVRRDPAGALWGTRRPLARRHVGLELRRSRERAGARDTVNFELLPELLLELGAIFIGACVVCKHIRVTAPVWVLRVGNVPLVEVEAYGRV